MSCAALDGRKKSFSVSSPTKIASCLYQTTYHGISHNDNALSKYKEPLTPYISAEISRMISKIFCFSVTAIGSSVAIKPPPAKALEWFWRFFLFRLAVAPSASFAKGWYLRFRVLRPPARASHRSQQQIAGVLHCSFISPPYCNDSNNKLDIVAFWVYNTRKKAILCLFVYFSFFI